MPSSALLLAGVVSVACAVGLVGAIQILRREVVSARRMLHRVVVAADEVERVDRARRQLVDGVGLTRAGASGVNRVVRRSGLAVAGIPYAILDSIGRIRRGNPP
jgi:hypothetical protein